MSDQIPMKRAGNPNWVKGQSGNPSGRPKGAAGLAAYIAEQTADGEELVDRLLELSRTSTSPKEQREATMALLDRLAGRPVSPSVNLTPPRPTSTLPENWATMSMAEKDRYLDSIEAQARALPAGT